MGLNYFAKDLELLQVNDSKGFGESISYFPVDAASAFDTNAFVSNGDFRVEKGNSDIETIDDQISFLSVDTKGVTPKRGDKITYNGSKFYVLWFRGNYIYDLVCSGNRHHSGNRSARRTK